jgi:hypothetical protein
MCMCRRACLYVQARARVCVRMYVCLRACVLRCGKHVLVDSRSDTTYQYAVLLPPLQY